MIGSTHQSLQAQAQLQKPRPRKPTKYDAPTHYCSQLRTQHTNEGAYCDRIHAHITTNGHSFLRPLRPPPTTETESSIDLITSRGRKAIPPHSPHHSQAFHHHHHDSLTTHSPSHNTTTHIPRLTTMTHPPRTHLSRLYYHPLTTTTTYITHTHTKRPPTSVPTIGVALP